MSSSRLDWIDISRGIFFFPMFIFHLFSIYDINTGTKYSSQSIINFLGYVRLLYIMLAGVSLYLAANSKKNQSISKFLKKRCLRSYHIAIYAIIITILTYFLYPNIMIKFGILHFLALGTLIVSPIAYLNSKYITFIFFVISIILSYGNCIPSISKPIDVILGGGKLSPYPSMDWFPLLKFMPYLLFGILIAQIFKFNNDNKNELNKKTPFFKLLEWMGKKSLELYTAHVIILLVIYYVIFNKNKK